MARRTRETMRTPPNATPPCVVPAGAPAWITPELLEQTLAVWQPYYDKTLTADDALGMILDVASLFAVLSEGDRREAISRIGAGQQP